jgi:hypothetical protein
MADYDAKIRISADTKAVESQLNQLERRIKNLQAPDVKGIRNIGEAFVPQQALGKLEKGLSAIANRANTAEKVFARLVEGVGTLSVAGVGLEGLNTALKNVASYTGSTAANFSGAARKIDEFAASGDALRTTFAQLNNLLVDVGHGVERVVVPGFAAMDDTAQAAASQANKLQFAMQQFLDSTEGIRTAVSQFGTLDGAAGAATAALAALAVVAETQLTDALHEVDTVGGVALKQLADDAARGVSELQRLIKATQGTVDQYEKLLNIGRERLRIVSADSDEARRAANTITRAQQLLNAELERQNNLLREAQGLRPQSVENRATNTYNVTQRGKENERLRRNEMAAVEQSIASISQQPTDFTRALGLDVADDKLRRFNAEMDKVQEALGRMETSGARNPFGITAQQIEIADHNAKKFASDIDLVNTQLNELVQIHRALGRMESQPRNVFGIELDQVEEVYNMRVKEEAAYEDLRLDTIRRSIDAELDGIDVVFKARNKANTAALKDFDKRLQGRQEIKNTRKKTAENVALGAGFPLLFGGGAGSVLGGAVGGLYQGNPMMSVVTSAIGTLVDQFVAGVVTMGASVNNLIGNFEALKTAMVFTSKEQEYQIKLLIDSGRVQEAANQVQERLIDIIGSSGLQALSEAGKASDELSRTWAEFSLQMQAFVAGPLAAFIKEISKTLGSINEQTKQAQTFQDVTTLYTQLNKEGKTKQAEQFATSVQKARTASASEFMADPAVLTDNVRKQIDVYKQFLKNKGEENAKLTQQDIDNVLKKNQELYVTLAEAERAQQDTKRQNAEQYFDLVLSLQRQQADLTAQYERRAQDMRIANQQKQLDLVKEKGSLEIQQAQNQATRTQIALGGGTGLTAEITAALDKYSIEVKRINGEAANAQEQAKLELIRLDIDNERFKMDNAKAIARTNYDNQVKIQRINDQIARQNAELNRKNYEQTIQTAAIELSNIRAGAQAEIATAKANLTLSNVTKDQLAFWQAIIDGFSKVVAETETAKTQIAQGYIKPSALPGMAAAPALAQPSTAGIDAQTNAAKKLTEQFNALAQARKKVNTEEAALALTQAVLQSVTQFEAQTKAINDEIAVRKLRNRLALEGVAPEIIEGEVRVFELTRQITETTKALDGALEKLLPVKLQNTNESYAAAVAYLAELEVLGQLTPKQEELRKKLQEILDLRKALQDATPGAVDGARGAAAKQVETPVEKIEGRIGALKKELAELTNLGNIAITVADGIGNAFGNAFKGLIDGSMTAREALSSFFKDVASMFLDMAAQIIAKQMTMIILQTILKALGAVAGASGGGGFGAGGNSFNANGELPAGTGNIPSLGSSYGFAKGGVFNSPKFFKFAEGGTMQNGVLGEAGPEAIMPLSRGAGGKLGVNASGLREAMGGAPGMGGSPVLSMSFETTRFGDTDYVSRDQLEAAMVQTRKQASADGAKRGMSMTLDRLQQSPQTRSRVGLR